MQSILDNIRALLRPASDWLVAKCAQLPRHTLAWAEAVNRSGAAYLTPAVIDGRWMVRVSIGALTTEAEDVAAVWSAIREAAESLPCHSRAI